MSTLQLPTATVFKPLLRPCRFKGAEGGRGSGKSHYFGDSWVDMSIGYPGLRTVFIREVQKSLKRSSKQLAEDKIDQYKLKPAGFRATKEEIHTPGGGVAIFQGMQDHTAESIKSLEGFDLFIVEEANKLSRRSLDLLTPTARSTPRTLLKQPELWFGWNRGLPDDPVDEMFRNMPPELGVCVHSTYRDNPFFPQELIPEIEWCRRTDPEKYAHVWEGGYLYRSAARVFNNWRVEEFELGKDGFPDEPTFYWGADWGFSVDPSVLVGCFLIGRTLYVAFEAWKVGCEIDSLPALFDTVNPDKEGFARRWPITADSARTDTISYMQRHGYPSIAPARKGPGSVEDGIEFLKACDIVVHPRCVHVIDELTHYSYKVDKLTEKVLPVLLDKKNHTMDSLRYALESVRWTVKGDAAALPGVTEQRYDASIAPPRDQRNGSAAADVSASFAGAAFDGIGSEFDGGLT